MTVGQTFLSAKKLGMADRNVCPTRCPRRSAPSLLPQGEGRSTGDVDANQVVTNPKAIIVLTGGAGDVNRNTVRVVVAKPAERAKVTGQRGSR